MKHMLILMLMFPSLACSQIIFGHRVNRQASAGNPDSLTAGDYIVTDDAELTTALAAAGAGDTVLLRAGTYTVALAPSGEGAEGNPLVFSSYGMEVCSLYTSTSAVSLSGQDYVYIQGLRLRTSPECTGPVVALVDAHHNMIKSCRLWGGSTFDDPLSYGTANAVELDSSNYNRILRCRLDRLDTAITADENRGEGFFVGQASYYNILEQDTAVHVSHFAFVVPRGPATNQDEISMRHTTRNIVRNCIAYDSHVGFGSTDYANGVMFEACTGYSPGLANTYRDGLAFEGTSRNGIYRFNKWYRDSVATVVPTNIEATNSVSTQSWGGVNWNNRYYHNAFMGGVMTVPEKMSALHLINDSGDQDSLGRDVFVNNIFTTYRAHGVCLKWQEAGILVPDTFRNNLMWGGAVGDTLGESDPGGPQYIATMQSGASHGLMLEATNFEASPLWVDSNSVREARSFELSASSPCVDAGVALTLVASGSSGTSVTVGDAGYFHYDWGASPYDRGDSVLIGTDRREIDSVDYTNNRLLLTGAVTVSAGVEIHIIATWSHVSDAYIPRLYGSAPDVGPYEKP